MADDKRLSLYPKPRITFGYAWKELRFLLWVIPAVAYGAWFDNLGNYRMVRFRDKSALYGGQLREGDPPSWP